MNAADSSRVERIRGVIQAKFLPEFIEIVDESSQHHRGGRETHFRLILVCKAFETLSLVERQRRVHSLLALEFESGLHALSLKTYSPAEWQRRGQKAPASVPCAHSRKPQNSG